MSARNATPPTLTTKDVDRFWSKVERVDDVLACWSWHGTILVARGYGQFVLCMNVRERKCAAHRIAFFLVTGEWPPVVMHWCDVRTCCNPLHGRAGTNDDNMRDMVAKGRSASGERNGLRLRPERAARGERNGMYTHPESRTYGDRNGQRRHPERTARGSRQGTAKLTEADIPVIRTKITAGRTQREIALEFNVNPETIGRINRRQLWRHVP